MIKVWALSSHLCRRNWYSLSGAGWCVLLGVRPRLPQVCFRAHQWVSGTILPERVRIKCWVDLLQAPVKGFWKYQLQKCCLSHSILSFYPALEKLLCPKRRNVGIIAICIITFFDRESDPWNVIVLLRSFLTWFHAGSGMVLNHTSGYLFTQTIAVSVWLTGHDSINA